MQLFYQKLTPEAYPPEQGYDGDLGFDIRTPTAFVIPAGQGIVVDTRLRIQLPALPKAFQADFVLGCFVWSKSGLSVKSNIEKGAGVIDPNYTGELKIKLYNHGDIDRAFDAGDKIAQLVMMVCARLHGSQEVDLSEWETARGQQGFGSSGR